MKKIIVVMIILSAVWQEQTSQTSLDQVRPFQSVF